MFETSFHVGENSGHQPLELLDSFHPVRLVEVAESHEQLGGDGLDATVVPVVERFEVAGALAEVAVHEAGVRAASAGLDDRVTQRPDVRLDQFFEGVLVAGGEWAPGDCTTGIDLYDPATNAFAAAAGTGSLGACGGFATKLLDGRIMGGGGYAGLGYSNQAAIFNPATSTVASLATMPRRRGNAAAAPIESNRILVCGTSFSGSASGE